jgi:TATA-box binding protein (TBP) (component of TFIID and TFIIIB)
MAFLDKSIGDLQPIIPAGNQFYEKRSFEYTTPNQVYDIEVFANTDGSGYAVAMPQSGKLVIYGSPNVQSIQEALHIVFQKIEREEARIVLHPPLSEDSSDEQT